MQKYAEVNRMLRLRNPFPLELCKKIKISRIQRKESKTQQVGLVPALQRGARKGQEKFPFLSGTKFLPLFLQ